MGGTAFHFFARNVYFLVVHPINKAKMIRPHGGASLENLSRLAPACLYYAVRIRTKRTDIPK